MSPRPKKDRKIKTIPTETFFRATSGRRGKVELALEEYEAIRLADYLLMDQKAASEEMEVSRPTFTRIYDRARKKVALALTEGKDLVIVGGDYILQENILNCEECKTNFSLPNINGLPVSCPVCTSKNLTLLDGNTLDDTVPLPVLSRVAMVLEEESLNSKADKRFGKCKFIGIYHILEDAVEIFPHILTDSGSAKQTVELLKEYQVDAVLSPDFGFNALKALKQADILAVNIHNEARTFKAIIKQLKKR